MSSASEFKGTIMKLLKYVFLILGSGLIISLAYYYYNVLSRPIAAILTFLGGFMAVYFYYIKWFVLAEQYPAWPPTVSVCPDFLTAIPPEDGKGNIRCVDFVGVSKNGNFKKAEPASLNTDLTDPQKVFEVDPKASLETLKADVIAKGLSWVSLFEDS